MLSKEHKRKISEGTKNSLPRTAYKKGCKPWNTGKSGTYSTKRKGKTMEEIYGIERAKEIRLKQSLAKKGKSYEEIMPLEVAKLKKKKLSLAASKLLKGKKRPDVSERFNKIRNAKEYNLNISSRQLQRLRKIGKYKHFREMVLKRDQYKCVNCGSTLNLEVDHIIPIFLERNKIFELDNGQTLCKSCHRIKTITELKNLYWV